MRSGLVACCLMLFAAAGRAQQPSPGGVVLLRFDAGMLNPDDPTKADLAAGASFGWSPGGANSFFARYLHQGAYQDAGLYVFGHARHFLLVQWEHDFEPARLYRRQFSSRLGLGILSSHYWSTALVVSGGMTLRYPMSGRVALVAGVEDNLAVLPYRSCFPDGSGGSSCFNPPMGGLQHNFGLLASVEWRPSAMPLRSGGPERAPVYEPAPPEPVTGAVCDRLRPASGTLVRVSTVTRSPTGVLVTQRSSEVGPLVRCADGTIALGPTLGQQSPDLTIFESSVTGAWTRGNQRLVGTAIGTGAGAVLGYVVGSAKSYLCNTQPCAKHRGTSTLIGAASGALVGFMLGQATPRWIRRYP